MKNSKCIPESPATLQVCHLTYAFDEIKVLDDISFEAPHGSRIAIVGPNGAGKSTLFKILVGLISPQSGAVSIHGKSLGSHHDCVSYVPQRSEIDRHFPVTVEDIVLMGRYKFSGGLRRPDKEDRYQTRLALEKLGLTKLRKKCLDELSGGQQQRTFLARAIAQEPHILLMDEPFSHVDVTTQEITLELLDDLQSKNATVMVSTHDLNLASQRFDLVGLLNTRLIAFGSPEKVFTQKNITSAFGAHVLNIKGSMVIDQCCPPDNERIHS